MLSTIEAVNSVVNNFIWGVPAMICIIGVGLYLSIRTRFLQIRKFPYSMKVTLGRMMKKKEASDGALTPFQAVCTALAATVGTGNVAGVAGAIAIGGPGAVFWMWVSALLGMTTKYAEALLAVKFRVKDEKGEIAGGPMYYIENGMGDKFKWLAKIFAFFGVVTALLGCGTFPQVNAITESVHDSFHIPVIVIGIIVTVLTAVVTLGGIQAISKVAQFVVPFMAIIYFIFAVRI